MTEKAYLVSWLGKGNITWTPLQESINGTFSLDPLATGPVKNLLNAAGQHSNAGAMLQQLFDPTMSKLNAIQSQVHLATQLTICTVGLQLATLVAVYKLTQKVTEINRKMEVIKGKLDLHFLERSLDFFLDTHENVTGANIAVCAALEADCYNALSALVSAPDLRIPAYLQYRLSAQAQTIESWNQFLYAVIHNGVINYASPERLEKWVKETDPTTKSLPHGGYASQSDVLMTWNLISKSKKKDGGIFSDFFAEEKSVLAKAMSPENFDRCYPALLLAKEIQNLMSFSEALEDKLVKQEEHSMLVKAV